MSKSILLGGKTYTEFLTKSDQIIAGNVKINGNLMIRNNLQINNLQTKSNIGGHDISALIDDTFVLSEDSIESKSIIGDKNFIGNVAFEQVIVHGNVFDLGLWKEIEMSLDQIQKVIELRDNVLFSNDLRINNLVIGGTINGINSNEFGHQWLLTESDQVIFFIFWNTFIIHKSK